MAEWLIIDDDRPASGPRPTARAIRVADVTELWVARTQYQPGSGVTLTSGLKCRRRGHDDPEFLFLYAGDEGFGCSVLPTVVEALAGTWPVVRFQLRAEAGPARTKLIVDFPGRPE